MRVCVYTCVCTCVCIYVCVYVYVCIHIYMLLSLLSCLSRVRLLATPWTAAHQAPPAMGFSRPRYWSGLPLPSPYIYIDTHTHM